MGETTYCCGLHPKGSVILIAIVDIILSLCLFFLSALALADLHKVSEIIERDITDVTSESNAYHVQMGINKFTHRHGQVVLVLLSSLISLFLASGLFLGVRKDWDCPIKAWLINGCVIVLLGVISLLVLSVVTYQLTYIAAVVFGMFLLLRIYEIWVVFDFLKVSQFTARSMTRSASSERLHNV
ncbi:hypothetical protein Fcan01_09861 [Folsomia candida]|uniref:Uncharacterized protein n=1 Tax=Folsomia candida TaxID=158441 RepID=A0A226EG84_FOLCA|nr:hypothetical protein Fcan01_09861 [Folsomia candida]